MQRITGSFPGGPTRRDTTPQRHGPVRMATVESLEEDRAARSLHRRRQARGRRVVWGFVLSLVAAGSLGMYLGIQSHRTPEEMSERAERRRSNDLDISKEVNRTLLELWRMEEIEAQRARGGLR